MTTLKQDIENLPKDLEAIGEYYYAAVVRGLARQVEELQADAERLDILQKYPSAVYHLRACWYSRRFDGHRQHETLRDAIDAVREVKK